VFKGTVIHGITVGFKLQPQTAQSFAALFFVFLAAKIKNPDLLGTWAYPLLDAKKEPSGILLQNFYPFQKVNRIN